MELQAQRDASTGESLQTKEALHKTQLEREVVETEKVELVATLQEAEMQRAELEIELNNIIMQMESERNQLWSAKQNLESERLGLRDELRRAEGGGEARRGVRARHQGEGGVD